LSLYRKPRESTFSEKSAEEKVFQMFCNKAEKHELDETGTKEPSVTYGKIEDYILKLSELAPIWHDVHNSKSKVLRKILTLNGSKEIKIFLAAIIRMKGDAGLKDLIFSNLEKILFRNGVPGIWIMDERTPASWARDVYNGEDILEGVNQKTSVLINTDVLVPNMIQAFKYLFNYERGPLGFHRWGTLKYFLFEYEEWLRSVAGESNEKVTLDDYDETTIEHIIPQGFSNHWQDEVNEVTDAFTDEHDIYQARKVLLNTLGNLTILKNGKNSSLGNRGWEQKKERFRTGSYNEIAISANNKWTRSNISIRGFDMMKFLQTKVTGLNLNDEDIKSALFYDDPIIKMFD